MPTVRWILAVVLLVAGGGSTARAGEGAGADLVRYLEQHRDKRASWFHAGFVDRHGDAVQITPRREHTGRRLRRRGGPTIYAFEGGSERGFSLIIGADGMIAVHEGYPPGTANRIASWQLGRLLARVPAGEILVHLQTTYGIEVARGFAPPASLVRAPAPAPARPETPVAVDDARDVDDEPDEARDEPAPDDLDLDALGLRELDEQLDGLALSFAPQEATAEDDRLEHGEPPPPGSTFWHGKKTRKGKNKRKTARGPARPLGDHLGYLVVRRGETTQKIDLARVRGVAPVAARGQRPRFDVMIEGSLQPSRFDEVEVEVLTPGAGGAKGSMVRFPLSRKRGFDAEALSRKIERRVAPRKAARPRAR